jgi:hypothetical protein
MALVMAMYYLIFLKSRPGISALQKMYVWIYKYIHAYVTVFVMFMINSAT